MSASVGEVARVGVHLFPTIHPVNSLPILFVEATIDRRVKWFLLQEIDALLTFLCVHICSLDFSYSVRWEKGLVIV